MEHKLERRNPIELPILCCQLSRRPIFQIRVFVFQLGATTAEEEWEAAKPVGRAGPMNALIGRAMPRAERIVQALHDLYSARVNAEDLDEVFLNLQNLLFKNVKVPLEEDVWRHPDLGGASQPAAQGEAEVLEAHLVVTREHVARQVETVIKYRENGWKQRPANGDNDARRRGD